MPKMHAISLLSSSALIGTFVGYAIARYGPQLSFASNRQRARSGPDSCRSKAGSTWIDRLWPMFNRRGKANSSPGSASGNQTFDAYRDEVLQQLQDEQQAFVAFLDQLRKSRDKDTFDAFLAERSSKRQE